MLHIDWTIAAPVFLTAIVEWVEAFTIVLAASLSIGWRASAGASAAAFTILALLAAATGSALSLGLEVRWLQLTVGIFLLLFGIRWMAKAIARAARLIPMHDEAQEFVRARAELGRGDWIANWVIAFKGVLLEGLEVWLVVTAFGLQRDAWATGAIAAFAALLMVIVMGIVVRAPLQRVPENTIKFGVGTMITTFGTYWAIEGATNLAWPGADWSLLALEAFFVLGGLAAIHLLRRSPTEGVGP